MTVFTPDVMMCSSGRADQWVSHLPDTHRPRDVTAMSESDLLAAEFEEHRDRLTAVAHRLLGSRSEAENAVQEAWLRGSRADSSDVDNLAGWLTTVVARVSLNQLRSRTSRREDPLDDAPSRHLHAVPDPAEEAVLADSVGLALLAVLDTLGPAERLAFALHALFAVPDPAEEGVLAALFGLARLPALDTLGPAERLSFVLHDLFDVPLGGAEGV